jgi:hypothetical protein
LAIPAYALYHAANAERTPNTPPAFLTGTEPLNSQMANNKYVMDKKKKIEKNATVDLTVINIMKNVKINQPIKYIPTAYANSFSFPSYAATIPKLGV